MSNFLGAAAEMLVFKSFLNSNEQSGWKGVGLYGYGGLEKIAIQNVTRDTNKKLWLSLGILNNYNEISKSFFVQNSGELASFVYIASKSEEYCEVDINPNFFILNAQELVEVTVKYRPSMQDLQKLQNSTILTVLTDIGRLKVRSGAEVTRSRLTKLCGKKQELGDEINSLAQILRQSFNYEKMPQDLTKFDENDHSSIRKIMNELKYSEVVITVERDLNQTVVPQYTHELTYQSLNDALIGKLLPSNFRVSYINMLDLYISLF